ncbi:TetR/AcrR family transcriptional regulator [Planobispora longispora]|uniref:HTH tetR-type domain-containing protein n=1 Tax=Planobispora longispora TaxID=28887 RepID=A0A8J3W470_9ACTN|nr:TetR/AcrR family transcriptional regulator [Planobispora longispora]BFE85310.1 hypothetical protein GCM10020093_079110 [Planobispora longispora]GIH75063.1 hypothetical protein Plo01_14920 [Planobispora longispora]
MRDRKAERHQSTKAEILGVAWEIARAEGLAGLTLRDVAHRVGMRPPSLYSYFASKDAVYDAMFAQGSREFLEWQAKVELTGDTLTDLKLIARYFVDFCTENPTRYQLLFQRTVPGFEPSAESFAVSVEGLEELRRTLAGIGITGPEALDLLTALVTGLTDQQISNDPGGDRWIRLIDQAMEMYFAHVSKRMKAGDEP